MATDVTVLLKNWRDGDGESLEKLIVLIYKDLHKMASKRLMQERPDHILQATALVHEAYLRLVEWQNLDWQSRSHFLAITAQIMRNILVDYARRYQADKRGGDLYRVSFNAIDNLAQEQDVDLVALDDAIRSLAVIDPQQSSIIELRYFAGLSIEETAEVLGISASSVSREWNLAKIWLRRALNKK